MLSLPLSLPIHDHQCSLFIILNLYYEYFSPFLPLIVPLRLGVYPPQFHWCFLLNSPVTNMLPNSRNTLPPSSYFTSKQLSAHLLLPFLLQHCFHLTSVTPVLMILFPSFWLFLIFLCGYLWILPTSKCWTASDLNLESSFFIILSSQVISPAFLVLETTCKPRHCTFFLQLPSELQIHTFRCYVTWPLGSRGLAVGYR